MMTKWQIYQQMARTIRWMHSNHEQRRGQMIMLIQIIERDHAQGEHVIAETLTAVLTFATSRSMEGTFTHSEVKAALRMFENTCAYWISEYPKLNMAQKTTTEELSERAEMRRADHAAGLIHVDDIPF